MMRLGDLVEKLLALGPDAMDYAVVHEAKTDGDGSLIDITEVAVATQAETPHRKIVVLD